ncbi:hypothetical protein Q4610_03105 [Sphingobium sp. HBC34]|uniref:Lipoprotein n=1 Tax=Sphingobium cyanobacteriorum TaxID=3063954 RepID=A0ABT8ZJ20_9SPHN|nr:hypothetical protein [Sphingobium sp. HBC34]MDO7834024.1 hypothetical protein [Sphingobium sp. HBC34]
MLATRRLPGRISLVSLAVLAACSTPPPPPPPTPPPPVVPTVRPVPPDQAAEGMGIPEKDADGKYLTANRGVTSNTALWHVRMALNVAALNCDKYGSTARLQYNQILAVHKPMLTAANAAVDRNYSVAYGNAGLGARERLNTVVYNFFALPPVIKHFCPVAVGVGAKVLATPSGQLLDQAPVWLAELEKPFQDFYAAYADYLRRLAEWQSRFGASVTVVVSPTPLPPPPVPPGDAPPRGWTPSVTASTVTRTATPPSTGSARPPVTPAAPNAATPPVTSPSVTPPSVARTVPDNSVPKLVVQPLPATGE